MTTPPPPPAPSKRHRLDIAREKRRADVLQMRVAGVSHRNIASRLGCSPRTVLRDLHAVLDEIKADQYAAADRLRTLTATAIDRQLVQWWTRALEDPGALDRVIRLLQERAKLFGLYAPEPIARHQHQHKVEHSGQVDGPPRIEVRFVSPDPPPDASPALAGPDRPG